MNLREQLLANCESRGLDAIASAENDLRANVVNEIILALALIIDKLHINQLVRKTFPMVVEMVSATWRGPATQRYAESWLSSTNN
jgi:hypothetical protein